MPHPADPELKYLEILPIDACKSKKNQLKQEVWWQENIGVHYFGLKKRRDIATVSRNMKK